MVLQSLLFSACDMQLLSFLKTEMLYGVAVLLRQPLGLAERLQPLCKGQEPMQIQTAAGHPSTFPLAGASKILLSPLDRLNLS